MKIKRVLILGGFSPGAIELFYKLGLEKCGITVECYGVSDDYFAYLNARMLNKIINKLSPDFYYRKINRKLLLFLINKHYDVILVFKGMELFPETVQELKKHAVLIANYNADHPFKFFFPGSGNMHVLNSIPFYDVHFSYAHKIVDQLQGRFNKPAYCVPFGYDSNIPVTSNGNGQLYIGRLLFIGAFDPQRVRYLNQLKTDKLDIYGEDKWKTRNWFRPYIRRAYRNKGLYNNDYREAITNSLGILNLLREQNIVEDSHNMRTFEVPGYAGLLISQRTSEQVEYFEEDKEAVFFDSVEELEEKLRYLSANPDAVHKMKRAGYNRSIQADYSYDHRSRQLLDCLNSIF